MIASTTALTRGDMGQTGAPVSGPVLLDAPSVHRETVRERHEQLYGNKPDNPGAFRLHLTGVRQPPGLRLQTSFLTVSAPLKG